MVKLALLNGREVDASTEEMSQFITQVLLPNPHWHRSGLLETMEWARYLQDKSTLAELKHVARYFLIYMENLSFTGYLFDKSEGHPEQGKEFNMPVVKQLREMYQDVSQTSYPEKELSHKVHEMENLCMTIGADPL